MCSKLNFCQGRWVVEFVKNLYVKYFAMCEYRYRCPRGSILDVVVAGSWFSIINILLLRGIYDRRQAGSNCVPGRARARARLKIHISYFPSPDIELLTSRSSSIMIRLFSYSLWVRDFKYIISPVCTRRYQRGVPAFDKMRICTLQPTVFLWKPRSVRSAPDRTAYCLVTSRAARQ